MILDNPVTMRFPRGCERTIEIEIPGGDRKAIRITEALLQDGPVFTDVRVTGDEGQSVTMSWHHSVEECVTLLGGSAFIVSDV